MPEGPPEELAEEPAACPQGDPLSLPAGRIGFWRREGEELEGYAIRTWGDLFASLPGSRVDRFGPPGYFETVRINGTGRPVILFEGVPLSLPAGGLSNVNSLPRGVVTGLSIRGSGLLPQLALSAPDGLVELTARPWVGGVPQSVVEATRGPDDYNHYLFGFQRDVWQKLWFQFSINVRRANSFVLESFDRKEIFIKGGFPLGRGFEWEGGTWSNENEELLFDPDLQVNGGFAHRGTEESGLAFVRLRSPAGWIGQWYSTRIQSAARALIDTVASSDTKENRQGGFIAGDYRYRSLTVDLAFRSERREGISDEKRRSEEESSLSAGVAFSPAANLECRASVVEEIVHDGDALTGGEGEIKWRWGVTSSIRLARARRHPTLRQWAAGWDSDGVVHFGEVGLRFELLPGRPLVRYFRREIDGARFLYSVDSYFEEGMTIDERTNGWEVALEGKWRSFEGECSWLHSRARDRSDSGRLPYQSDHVIRARGAWRRAVPYIKAGGRIDLLGEWRSDRTAPGRTSPMDDYYYLRGRVTLDLSGVNLFGQLEQMLGNSLEYIDAAPPGGDGALSGTMLAYFGLSWPLED